jgi:hypothetical protein
LENIEIRDSSTKIIIDDVKMKAGTEEVFIVGMIPQKKIKKNNEKHHKRTNR